MIVRRTAVLTGALLLGVTCLRAASQVEADPHELCERAREYLADGELADAEERAFLTHTESYERTERLLEVDVLKRMADTAGDDILGLLAGDPELESVLTRFRQLKRDLMQIVAERDQLETDVKKSHDHNEAHLGALAAVVTDDYSLKAYERRRRLVIIV